MDRIRTDVVIVIDVGVRILKSVLLLFPKGTVSKMKDIHGQALCIINPVAGKNGEGGKIWLSLKPIVSQYYEVADYYTKQRRDATAFTAEHSAGKDIIVCVGGDGTLNEVVTAIVQNGFSTPLLYIPAGTTNDFARTIRASKKPESAFKLMSDGIIVSQDVGLFDDKYVFVYVAAFGTITQAASKTSQKLKNRWGYLAYIIAGLKLLLQSKPVSATISTDTDTITGDFLLGFFSNSISVGGIVGLEKKKVALNDGRFELLLVRYPKNIFSFLATVYKLLTGVFDEKQIIFMRASHVNFRSKDETQWTIDGETVDAFSDSINIGVKPKAFQLYVDTQVLKSALYI